MKITCDSCQSKYNVSDEKVQGKTVKIRCKKCGATLIVNGAGAHSAAGADVPPGGGADASFTVNVADGDQRTMSMAEIVAAYNERVIDQETFVWTDGMGDWQPLGQVESIVMALNAPSSHEQAAPAYEQPAYDPPPAAYAAPAAEERRAAVVKREGSRGTRDLFGGGGAAGMEEVASSAPAFDGSGAMPMNASPAAGGATGQRNETSVLFSLSALTRTETPAPVAVTGGGARKEDSGLIDLKALTESAAAMSPRGHNEDAPAALFPSTVGSPFASPFGAPLGSFDAPQVPAGSIAPPAQKKNMAVILVIAATVVALAAIIAVAIVVKSGRDRDSAAAAAAASASAAAAATPTVTAEPVASSAPTADPTPPPAASTSATVAAAKKPPVPGVKPPPGTQQPPKPPPGPGDPPAPPKPPPPKPGGDCGCNGDLMCLMACRAKK